MRTCLQCGQQTDSLHCPTDGMATVVQGVTPASAILQEGTIFAGRYRIVGVLGRGGMGAVYEAQHTGTGQAVAIKTLLLDNAGDTSAVRRFFHEARMTAGLQHPNTVRVFDFGQSDEGIFYLAMERLRGETLGDMQLRLDAQARPMTQQEAGRIAIDVLRSLAEAHKAGLVHRDLKPANIYLHDIGTGEHVVKVLDFGIAKSDDTHLTKTGTSIGTPSYMSPEQVMSGIVDGRSDLYALGVILYGCVAGVLPFQADSSYSMMMKHVAEPAPDLNALHLAGITSAFAAVVQKALEKKPEDRFADAQGMREALEKALAAPAAPRPAPLKPKQKPAAVAPADASDAPTTAQATPTAAKAPVAPTRPNNTALLVVGVVAAVTAMAGVGVWWTMSHGDDKVVASPDAASAEPDANVTVDVQAVVAPDVFIAPDVPVAPAPDVAPDIDAGPDEDSGPDLAVGTDAEAEPDVPTAPPEPAVAADPPPAAPQVHKPVARPKPRPTPPANMRAPGHSDRAPGSQRPISR